MTITAETLRLTHDLRLRIDGIVDQHTRDLAATWAYAWDDLAAELDAALVELAERNLNGWPARRTIARTVRIQRAMRLAKEQLDELTRDVHLRVTNSVGDVVDLSTEAQRRIVSSQFPPQAGDPVAVAATMDRVDAATVGAIIERSTQQITALTWPLSAAAYTAMQRALVRGVALGENPRETARRMLTGLHSAFNGGLTRALTIASTELLDASRAAAAAQHRANASVLSGWVWLAQLDRRTCPSCWSRHGEFHPLDEDGPLDHQRGRCARMPVTRSWRELGFDQPEPPSAVPDAHTVFRGLPRGEQLAVMGPGRLAALDSGDAQWSDLSALRTTAGWRDSYGVTPVRDLVPTH